MKKKTKTVKAWAVLNHKHGLETFSGSPVVFWTKKLAKTHFGYLSTHPVVPCTITYQLVPRK